MNNLQFIVRKLTRKGEHSIVKVLSLAIGLSFSILMLSEVFYYHSFDACYPDNDRIFFILSEFDQGESKERDLYGGVSGAVAPGIKAEIPGVESAVRMVYLGGGLTFYTPDKKSYKANFNFTDPDWSEVLKRPILLGNPKEVLSSPMQCMISERLANSLGKNPVGMELELSDYPNKKLTVGGVYKTIPDNTFYKYDVLISMVSLPNFFAYDGRNQWEGNDFYRAFVKLKPGVDVETLKAPIRAMQERHQNLELQKQKGSTVSYRLEPLREIYANFPEVKSMSFIMICIALIILSVSLMNYVLLTVGSLINRTKTVAIQKCYGAGHRQIYQSIFSETFIVFITALLASLAFIYAIRTEFESIVYHKMSSMFTPYVVFPILFILLIILFVISYFPGRFCAHTPVIQVFRKIKTSGMKMKALMLFFQIVGTTLVLSFLLTVSLQYSKMIGADHGFDTEQVHYAMTRGMTSSKITSVMESLKQLPEIEMVASGSAMPYWSVSGDVLIDSKGESTSINVSAFSGVDALYLKALGIEIIQGKGFEEGVSKPKDIVVSEHLADQIITYYGGDGVVGKQVWFNDFGYANIVGVYRDVYRQFNTTTLSRPSYFAFNPEHKEVVVLKLSKENSTILSEIESIFNRFREYDDITLFSLKEEMDLCYTAQKGFRNGIFWGGIIALAITIIGLLGYSITEVNRRQRELAIRKINGAEIKDILNLFVGEILRFTLPGVLVGLILSYYLSTLWLYEFSLRITLSPLLFVGAGLLLLVVVVLIVMVNCWRLAQENPAKILKNE